MLRVQYSTVLLTTRDREAAGTSQCEIEKHQSIESSLSTININGESRKRTSNAITVSNDVFSMCDAMICVCVCMCVCVTRTTLKRVLMVLDDGEGLYKSKRTHREWTRNVILLSYIDACTTHHDDE